jgi:hypothetical protein
MTDGLQTEVIQQTYQFRRFERNLSHFFDECEQGFINEFIIELFCRLQLQDGAPVISYSSRVQSIFFIMNSRVEVYNQAADEIRPNEPILYLPKYSYFGDYQILYDLKSNLEFRTIKSRACMGSHPNIDEPSLDELALGADDADELFERSTQFIYFFCISKDKFRNLCDVFPMTAENIKRRSRERRNRFM